jgi:hypothetical protein
VIVDALTPYPASGDEIARATGVPRATTYRYSHAFDPGRPCSGVRYGWRLPTVNELVDKDGLTVFAAAVARELALLPPEAAHEAHDLLCRHGGELFEGRAAVAAGG